MVRQRRDVADVRPASALRPLVPLPWSTVETGPASRRTRTAASVETLRTSVPLPPGQAPAVASRCVADVETRKRKRGPRPRERSLRDPSVRLVPSRAYNDASGRGRGNAGGRRDGTGSGRTIKGRLRVPSAYNAVRVRSLVPIPLAVAVRWRLRSVETGAGSAEFSRSVTRTCEIMRQGTCVKHARSALFGSP